MAVFKCITNDKNIFATATILKVKDGIQGEQGLPGADGQPGKDGNGIDSITYYYKATDSQTAPAAAEITNPSMTDELPLTPLKRYLWQKEVITYTDSGKESKITVLLLTAYGETGATGDPGIPATLLDVIPSSTVFKSTDGGLTFNPSTITLTPRFQTTVFGKWYYSTNGGTTWTQITSTTVSTTAPYYNATSKILTIPKGFTKYTDKITSIVFKCEEATDPTIYDTATISKIYDVTDLQIGGRNLLLGTGKAIGDVAKGTGTVVENLDLYTGLTGVTTTAAGQERLMNLKAVAERNGFKVGDNLVASVYIKAQYDVTVGSIKLYRSTGTGNTPGSIKEYTNVTLTPQ